MDKKTQEYLAKVEKWIEKSPEGATDIEQLSTTLAEARRTIDEVETLKARLAEKKKQRSLAVHVLEETFKSAKHARRAQAAREKARAPAKTPKVKAAPAAKAEPVGKGKRKAIS